MCSDSLTRGQLCYPYLSCVALDFFPPWARLGTLLSSYHTMAPFNDQYPVSRHSPARRHGWYRMKNPENCYSVAVLHVCIDILAPPWKFVPARELLMILATCSSSSSQSLVATLVISTPK